MVKMSNELADELLKYRYLVIAFSIVMGFTAFLIAPTKYWDLGVPTDTRSIIQQMLMLTEGFILGTIFGIARSILKLRRVTT